MPPVKVAAKPAILPAFPIDRVFGLMLAYVLDAWGMGWFHAKLACVIALTSGEIVLLSDDREQRIETEIDESIESVIILEDDPLHLLIGTEGPHIYRYRAGLMERNAAFDLLECRDEWYTPYGSPPELRSFAATRDGWVYADVHVGSIMRSSDLGVSWEPVTPDLHEDVHQVATSSRLLDRVYANTADAIYVSEDRGDSWDHRAEGLPFHYGRVVLKKLFYPFQ